MGTIVEIDDYSLKVLTHKEGLDNPHQVILSLKQYNDLDYSYAATIHKAQGVTVDQSFILASQYLDRYATYVGMTRHTDNVELFWSKEEFQNYEAMVFALSREKSKEFSLDYPEQEFAAHRGIESAGWPKFESYPVELNPNQDGILDWKALRQDVESHYPELAQEFTQRMTENHESDLELQNKPEKDAPDWHADLFYGFDKKQGTKEDFSDLFYGINVDLSKDEKAISLDREAADDKEIAFCCKKL